MNRPRLDIFWHKTLRRPYRLIGNIDQGDGPIVVLLHGIAASSNVWRHLADDLNGQPVRLIAFDLLGFGSSPKPEWPQYSIDDHASAVLAAIHKLRPKQPIILVGHSMGCLVAAHIAWREPKLVRSLILYEAPLYATDVNDSRLYKFGRNARLAVYKRMLAKPQRTIKYIRTLGKVATRFDKLKLDESSWIPFAGSLQNTIIQQQTYQELLELKLPIDIIYGTLDLLVIRANMRNMFKDSRNVTFHALRETHGVSARASLFLAGHIKKVLGLE